VRDQERPNLRRMLCGLCFAPVDLGNHLVGVVAQVVVRTVAVVGTVVVVGTGTDSHAA